MENDMGFLVKTVSYAANKALLGGFRPGEGQVIYASPGSGTHVIMLSAAADAIRQGLPVAYFDFGKSVSLASVEAAGLSLDGDLFNLFRSRPLHSIGNTLQHAIEKAEGMGAKLVVLDFSTPHKLGLIDRVFAQSDAVGDYSRRVEQEAAHAGMALAVILPSRSAHWRAYGAVCIDYAGPGSTSVSRGPSTEYVHMKEKNGEPYAIDESSELVRALIARPLFCEQDDDGRYRLTDAVPPETRRRLGEGAYFKFYELGEKLRTDDGLAESVKDLVTMDADDVVLWNLSKKLGVRYGNEINALDKAKRILSFDGEIGNFGDVSPNAAQGVIDVWEKLLREAGVSIDFQHVDDDVAIAVGRAIGADSAAAAAFAGVPVEDIFVD